MSVKKNQLETFRLITLTIIGISALFRNKSSEIFEKLKRLKKVSA